MLLFLQCDLWNIIGDSGFVVSSLVSSASASFSFHLLTGKMGTRPLKETPVEGHIKTCLYQMQMLHKEFAQPLNVVIIVKTNLRTQARAHVVLFSSDLDLAYVPLVDYYSLRFQIEFNFRDAKQYWG